MTAQVSTVEWTGKSGRKYTYWVYPLPVNFTSVPGNYIFAKRNERGQWVPVYIGETGDLSERFENHHAMHCIRKNNATHLLVHKSSSERSKRLNEETDLLQNYSPSCNKQ